MTTRRPWLARALVCGLGLAAAPSVAEPPPSPYRVVERPLLSTPVLDPMPLCGELVLDPPLAAVVELGEQDPEAALLAIRAQPALADQRLLAESLRAYHASSKRARLMARARLRDALDAQPVGRAAACGHYELARLERSLGLLPEAVTSTGAALRAARGARPGARFLDALRLVRAEVLYRAARTASARVDYLELARSSDPRLVASARLRLADLWFDEGAHAAAFARYRELLPELERALGVSPLAWAPRAAEAALAEGELTAARRWLQAAVQDPPSEAAAALFSIRLADVLAAQGEEDAARALLAEVEARNADRPEGRLAVVRALALGLVAADEQTLAKLASAADAPPPGLAVHARATWGALLVAGERIDQGLPLLVHAAYAAPFGELERYAQQLLEQAVRAAVARNDDEASCPALLQLLGERRLTLIRRVPDPQPFLQLGACYEVLGLPQVALEIYRSLARRFGGRVGEDLALPVARASFAVGDLETARRAGLAELAAGRASPGWRRLLARVHLARGEPEAALALAVGLVREPGTQGADLDTLRLLGRALGEGRGSAAGRALLSDALLARFESPQASPPVDLLLLAARHHRNARESSRARALYALVLERFPGDARAHSQASYWLGALATDADRSREALEQAVAGEGGSFAELARRRLALDELRQRLALPPAAAGERDG